MRITGFSGMDIDGMVTKLMTAKRAPLNKLSQQKTILQWTRDSYREVNSKIVDFKNTKIKSFNLSAAMNTQKAVVTGNTTAVKAEATADANGAPMSIEVVSLATKSYMQSGALTKTTAGDVKLNTTLGELSGNAGESYDLIINGKTISLSKDDTIANAINKINATPDAKVNATFDEISGKFSITAKEYGATNNITGGTGSFATLLGLGAVQGAKQSEVIIKSKPSDATGRTLHSDNNSLTVNGINLTLLATNTAADPVTITTEADSTKAMDTIKAFVENYNSLLSMFNTKVGEEQYKSFQPLTDDQKKEMKESDVTAWEAKAKSGLLKNDEILKSAILSMRSIISSKIGELSSIGITTGQYYEGGKIYINEEKLKVALESDSQKVISIFKGTADGTTSGVYEKLSKTMDDALTKLVDKAGTSKFSTDANSIFKEESVMGRKLKDYNKRISGLEDRLKDMETRYYKQFSAMEAAMSKYENQSTSLSNFFK
ncbi:flagellar filament capping protein FliD [Paenibacillus sp. NPDC058177]|uniref:flagellar filament capping protein FliD n=1 Tax=Paenibacillus sp. NPDC058177 TaxID=3346369 RepID=UPI0036DE4063